MKRLGILFFCVLFALLTSSCGGKGTPARVESAVYYGTSDRYAVVIKQNFVGYVDKKGELCGRVVDYSVTLIPLTLDAEKREAEVAFEDGTIARNKDKAVLKEEPEVVVVKADVEEGVVLSRIATDKSVFKYFDGAEGAEVRGYYVTGYGNIYYFCGSYTKEKLLYGVMFDEKFAFLTSIGTI